MNTSSSSEFRVEPAGQSDIPLILTFIKGLAEYEGLVEAFFGSGASAEAVIAYSETEPVGFAVFFHTYSTFLRRPGLYLEDLFVLPEWRGRGAGRRLLSYVANIAVARHCGRLEWSVLDWNEAAIDFYRGLGARPEDAWTVYRLTGDALEQLGGEST